MMIQGKAQSVLEQVMVMVVVVGALLWMKGWIQNSLQGKLKQGADSVGNQFDPTKTSAVHLTTTTTTMIEQENAVMTITNSQELDKSYTAGQDKTKKPK